MRHCDQATAVLTLHTVLLRAVWRTADRSEIAMVERGVCVDRPVATGGIRGQCLPKYFVRSKFSIKRVIKTKILSP